MATAHRVPNSALPASAASKPRPAAEPHHARWRPPLPWYAFATPGLLIGLWFAVGVEPRLASFGCSTGLVGLAAGALMFSERQRRQLLIDQLNRVEGELRRRLRSYDPSASTISHAYFSERLMQEVRRSLRYNLALSLVVMRIGAGGKDSPGKGWTEAGAAVVTAAAKLLRTEDVLGYLGPSEYAFFLPHTDGAGAEVVMVRLQDSLAELRPVLGLGVLGQHGVTGSALMDAARRDLQGRQRAASATGWNEYDTLD